MDDRDRAAPVALAADAPVAQAELGLARAVGAGFQVGDDGVEGGGEVLAVVLAAVDGGQAFLVGVPGLPFDGAEVLAFGGVDLPDRQAVLVGELEVALVVGRHGHHRALAVAPEHVVGDEHRQFVAAQRVDDELAGGQALLLHGRHVGLGHRAGLAFGDERLQFGVVLGGALGQRVLGGDGDVGGAHQGVRAGRVDLQLAGLADAGDVVVEDDVGAEALADPVALHGLDLLGPAGQLVQATQQFFRIGGDAEVVHGDLALLDQGAGAPAAAVDDLLVGQHGLVDRVPVHHRVAAVGQALAHQAGEHALLVDVIVRTAGGELARPVDRDAQRLQLLAHGGDVVVGPALGVDAALHGRVLGGHAERVPAHRVQDVKALGALVARHDVAHGVVADVAHVDAARRVREHLEHVVFRTAVVDFAGLEDVGLRPGFTPLGLGVFGIVAGHRKPGLDRRKARPAGASAMS